MLRISYFLHIRLTDGGNVVSLAFRPLLYSSETFFLLPVLISVRELNKLIKVIHEEWRLLGCYAVWLFKN
jgi:hypothetical protein